MLYQPTDEYDPAPTVTELADLVQELCFGNVQNAPRATLSVAVDAEVGEDGVWRVVGITPTGLMLLPATPLTLS